MYIIFEFIVYIDSFVKQITMTMKKLWWHFSQNNIICQLQIVQFHLGIQKYQLKIQFLIGYFTFLPLNSLLWQKKIKWQQLLHSKLERGDKKTEE